jgi:hypothetical protein
MEFVTKPKELGDLLAKRTRLDYLLALTRQKRLRESVQNAVELLAGVKVKTENVNDLLGQSFTSLEDAMMALLSNSESDIIANEAGIAAPDEELEFLPLSAQSLCYTQLQTS